MFCSNCGAPVVEGNTFCTECGRRVEGPAAPVASTSGAGVGTAGAGKGPEGQGATMNTTAPSLLDRWKYNSGIRHLIMVAVAISILLLFNVFSTTIVHPIVFLETLCPELVWHVTLYGFFMTIPIAFIIFPLVILLLPLLPPHGYVVAIRIWGIAAIGIFSLLWMPFYPSLSVNMMNTGFLLHSWPLMAWGLVQWSKGKDLGSLLVGGVVMVMALIALLDSAANGVLFFDLFYKLYRNG